MEEQHVSISFSELDNFFNSRYGNNIDKIIRRSISLISDKDILICFLKHHLEDFMTAPKCSCASEEKTVYDRCLPISVFDTWIFPSNIMQCPLIDYTLADVFRNYIENSEDTFENLIASVPVDHRDEVIRAFHDGHAVPSIHVALMQYPMDSEIATSEVN
jgi:hypothetical protein